MQLGVSFTWNHAKRTKIWTLKRSKIWTPKSRIFSQCSQLFGHRGVNTFRIRIFVQWRCGCIETKLKNMFIILYEDGTCRFIEVECIATPPDGMLFHDKVPLSICHASLTVCWCPFYSWEEKDSARECFSHENIQFEMKIILRFSSLELQWVRLKSILNFNHVQLSINL